MQLLHGKTSVAQNKKANETKINKQTEEKKKINKSHENLQVLKQ